MPRPLRMTWRAGLRPRRLPRQRHVRDWRAKAALKLGELSNGAVATCFDSPLGFRHGRTFVAARTLVSSFNDPLTRRYDLDLVDERNDGCAPGADHCAATQRRRRATGADDHRRRHGANITYVAAAASGVRAWLFAAPDLVAGQSQSAGRGEPRGAGACLYPLEHDGRACCLGVDVGGTGSRWSWSMPMPGLWRRSDWAPPMSRRSGWTARAVLSRAASPTCWTPANTDPPISPGPSSMPAHSEDSPHPPEQLDALPLRQSSAIAATPCGNDMPVRLGHGSFGLRGPGINIVASTGSISFLSHQQPPKPLRIGANVAGKGLCPGSRLMRPPDNA